MRDPGAGGGAGGLTTPPFKRRPGLTPRLHESPRRKAAPVVPAAHPRPCPCCAMGTRSVSGAARRSSSAAHVQRQAYALRVQCVENEAQDRLALHQIGQPKGRLAGAALSGESQSVANKWTE